jgi:glycosyltransferase involved in cell wall biosynthesis
VKRQWAINGRFLTQPVTGVQRYAQEMVLTLDALLASRPNLAADLNVELLVPGDGARPLNLQAIETKRIGNLGGHTWEQFLLPAYVRGGLISFCNTGPLSIRKQIVCIHDLNTRRYPASYSPVFRAYYRLLQPIIGRNAAAVATVSGYSADLIEYYGVALRDRIFVAPNGHEHALRWTPCHSKLTAEIASPDTIVLLGSRAIHKNIELVTNLAPQLHEMGLKLAIVGASDPRVFKQGSVQKSAGSVYWLGRLDDNELAALLQDSMCLAFPSFEEGFGLPPLEAMTIGCPVVSSDRASLPEICGDAALFASPDNPPAWLDCFARLKNNPDLRRRMKVLGSLRASRFRWAESADSYLAAMAIADGREPVVKPRGRAVALTS